ncbi:MAG: pentapeptide repeat-containing protein [Glycocaulis sp.]
MDGWPDIVVQKPVGFTQRVRDSAGAAWKAVSGFFGNAGRFVSNHFIKFFLVFWLGASAWVFFWIVDLANPCRGTNLVCPGVEWIRPGYLAEDFRNLLWAASLVFGGAGAGAALINALRRTRLMHSEHELKRSGQDAETFSRAVDQLGSEQTAIRLGAIYALEGLMRSAFADGGDKIFGRQIGETLAAFVREQSAQDARLGEIRRAEEAHEPEVDGEAKAEDNYARLAVDREAAVAVLVRSWPFEHRPDLYGAGGVDLSASRLAWLKLPHGADLRGFNLSRSDLQAVYAHRANLHGTQLEGANLRRAALNDSNLQDAVLMGANLSESLLENAKMFRAGLMMANLENAWIASADLRDCSLFHSNLSRALLFNSNLDGASLYGADLSSARFNSKATKRAIPNLTRVQLEEARWLEGSPPELPDKTELPHRGDGKPINDPSPFDESWMKNVGPRSH